MTYELKQDDQGRWVIVGHVCTAGPCREMVIVTIPSHYNETARKDLFAFFYLGTHFT